MISSERELRRRNAVNMTPNTHCENLGLLANGSAGRWDVSIDCTISGVERWFAQIVEAFRQAAQDFPKRTDSVGPTNGTNDAKPAQKSKK